MKQHTLQIKIADLLKETGKKDDITFQNIRIEALPNIKSGVSGEVELQSLNEESILVSLKDVVCMTQEICDSCTSNYQKELGIENYTTKFIDPKQQDSYQQDEDEIFFIDPKNDIIDVYEMLIQAIKLQEPIIKRCNTCEKTIQDDIDDMENRETFESNNNIIFK